MATIIATDGGSSGGSYSYPAPKSMLPKRGGYAPSVHTTTVTLRRGVTTVNVNVPPPTGTKKVPSNYGYVDRPCWDVGGACSDLPPGVQPGDSVSTPSGDISAMEFFNLGFELPPGAATLEVGETKKEINLPLVLGGVAVAGLLFGFLIGR